MKTDVRSQIMAFSELIAKSEKLKDSEKVIEFVSNFDCIENIKYNKLAFCVF